jgi:hypothetical protein
MKSAMDFEDFLMEVHAEIIHCTEEDCLDDDLVDAFYEWYENLDEAVRDRYIDLFGKTMFVEGYKKAMDDTNKTLERIMAK